MLSKGFKEVYHLKGGILKYLENVAKQNSLWDGECFVFDNRTSVDHDLENGVYDLCHKTSKTGFMTFAITADSPCLRKIWNP